MSKEATPTESVFEARVDAWVARALLDPAQDFPQLLRALPGVYPTAVLAAIDRMVMRGSIDPDRAQRLHRESATGEGLAPCRRSLLPLPHPIDYEWRFSPRAGRELLDLASTLSCARDKIMLLGTPSVAHEAMSHAIDRTVSFLGPDNSVTRRLSALNQALDSPIEIGLCTDVVRSGTAQVVIIDPPWYLDFVRPMLITAAAACRLGGYLLASLPPAGARAKAALDRARLFRLAARLGLDVDTEHPLSVEYDTPFFEANALGAAGIAPMRAWRRGDLVVLRKRENRPQHSLGTPRASHWREIQIRQMRLFVGIAPRSGGRGLISLIDGDILPTVSRRDVRRRAALIWTSGNRIFGTDDTEIAIAGALQAADRRGENAGVQPQLCGTISERDEIERVAEILRDVAAREATEERAMRPAGDGKGGASWTSAPTSSWNEFPLAVPG